MAESVSGARVCAETRVPLHLCSALYKGEPERDREPFSQATGEEVFEPWGYETKKTIEI